MVSENLSAASWMRLVSFGVDAEGQEGSLPCGPRFKVAEAGRTVREFPVAE